MWGPTYLDGGYTASGETIQVIRCEALFLLALTPSNDSPLHPFSLLLSSHPLPAHIRDPIPTWLLLSI